MIDSNERMSGSEERLRILEKALDYSALLTETTGYPVDLVEMLHVCGDYVTDNHLPPSRESGCV